MRGSSMYLTACIASTVLRLEEETREKERVAI
jgi:hypothetical protein